MRIAPITLLISALAAVACTAPALVHPRGAVDVNQAPPEDPPIVDPPAVEACDVPAPTDALTLQTTRGLVKGVDNGDNTAFLGIPFAEPPTGERRFRAPVPAACSAEVFDASSFGAMCPQPDPVTGIVVGEEDCLSLNVWTPALPSGAALKPVMFFIHGGANLVGASGQNVLGYPLYDGSGLAVDEDVVVVTPNYRLGVLGFLAHPALAAESEHASSGNYGILDLVAALQWVHDNVAKFGGDPARVMVFGESAGAFNTCALMASPLAKGLFSAALMESGVCEFPDGASAQVAGTAIAASVGCTDATCLRALTVDDLVQSVPMLTLGITQYLGAPLDLSQPLPLPVGSNVDGWVLPQAPLTMMNEGTANHVPFVVGSNKDEIALFTLQDTRPYDCLDAEGLVRSGLGAAADDVLAHYTCNPLFPRQFLVDIVTDYAFTCPARRTVRAAAGHGDDVYRYYFTYSNPVGPTAAMGAFHAAELPFVFQMTADNLVAPLWERDLSSTIGGYWARFAATGDPNGDAAPYWEAFDPSRDDALVLDVPVALDNGVDDDDCDLWDSFL